MIKLPDYIFDFDFSGSSGHPVADGGTGNYWLRHAGGHWLCYSSQPPLCGQVPTLRLAYANILYRIYFYSDRNYYTIIIQKYMFSSVSRIPLWAGVLITITDTFVFLFLDKYGTHLPSPTYQSTSKELCVPVLIQFLSPRRAEET